MANSIDHLYDQFHEVFHFDPDTGILSWKVSPRYGISPGDPAGHSQRSGHLNVKLGRKTYKVHRVGYLMIFGHCPPELDHIDGSPGHNWISNLRPATRTLNQANKNKQGIGKSSKWKGVYLHKKTGNWIAQIKRVYLGSFRTELEAAKAYDDAARREFGEFARLNEEGVSSQ